MRMKFYKLMYIKTIIAFLKVQVKNATTPTRIKVT